MKMSGTYMKETVEFLGKRGFAVETRQVSYGTSAAPALGTRYALAREEELLVLETVEHPTAGESYYLEIQRFHGLRSFSFPLDSWKHRTDRVEFKYYALPDDGRALSLTLELAPP